MIRITKWLESKLSRLSGHAEAEVEEEAIPMPDIYSIDEADTIPDLSILDDAPLELDASVGFDPYDTAAFSKKIVG
jgi:hypothetical protein